ncbi:MAG: hypothetical protein IJV00_07920 [Clostridia bacterium]|nr:hypothetical protein [Clostridia bacterium]
MKNETKNLARENLTILLRRRSAAALCCVILTLIIAFYSILTGVGITVGDLGLNWSFSFIYYTMLSNLFAALSAAFVFPYTVEGVRRKRFVLPEWAAVLYYVAASSIAVTMVFVFAFMSWNYPEEAFGGANLATHVICPILIILSFFQTESGRIFTFRDRLLGAVPFGIYSIVYLVEVEMIGEKNGGLPDVYHVKDMISPYLALPILLILAFGVSTAVALISNRITKKRNKKTFALWSDDLDPIEVKIEAYGLGRAAGRHGDRTGIQIPYDILSSLAQRYGADPEELLKAFIKGMTNELKDRKKLL